MMISYITDLLIIKMKVSQNTLGVSKNKNIFLNSLSQKKLIEKCRCDGNSNGSLLNNLEFLQQISKLQSLGKL